MGALVHKGGSETLKNDEKDNFFDFKVKDIEGNLVNFNKFKGKKAILVVNVACK